MNIWIPLLLSLKVALWAVGINLLLGIACGFVLARGRFWGRDVLDTLLTLPMVMPPTVLGYYLLVLIGRNGTLGSWLNEVFGIQLIFTWQGAVIAAVIVSFPLVFKPARAAFEQVDPNMEAAARLLGLSRIATFFRVTLPLAWRGILAGVLLAFARALGEFGATLMVAGSIPGKTQTLSTAVYEAVQAGRDGDARERRAVEPFHVVAVLRTFGDDAVGRAHQGGFDAHAFGREGIGRALGQAADPAQCMEGDDEGKSERILQVLGDHARHEEVGVRDVVGGRLASREARDVAREGIDVRQHLFLRHVARRPGRHVDDPDVFKPVHDLALLGGVAAREHVDQVPGARQLAR